jgi:hypothetical protein
MDATDKIVTNPRTFDTIILASKFLIHRVTPTTQTCRQCTVIGTACLSLLLFVVALLLLLSPLLIPSSKAAYERPGRRTNCGTFAGISRDCAADYANRCAARATAQNSALLSLLRWRGRGHLWICRIDTSLLNCPNMTLVAVLVLLVRALILGRVDVHLLRYRWLTDQCPKERGHHQPGRPS